MFIHNLFHQDISAIAMKSVRSAIKSHIVRMVPTHTDTFTLIAFYTAILIRYFSWLESTGTVYLLSLWEWHHNNSVVPLTCCLSAVIKHPCFINLSRGISIRATWYRS